jgi:hypothetical protein
MELHQKSSRGNSKAKMTENEPATQNQVNRLYAVLHSLGINPKQFKKDNNLNNLQDLTRRQISDWIDTLEAEEAAANSTPEKSTDMEDSIKEAIPLVDTYIQTDNLDDNVRAQVITQLSIEINRTKR